MIITSGGSSAVIATRLSRGEHVTSEDESVEVVRDPLSIDPTTQIPIKIGELIAQLHFLMVSKALTRIKKKKEVGILSCRGLLVDKQTGGKLVTASISCKSYEQKTETMNIKVEYFPGGVLTPQELCWYLNRLVQYSPTLPPPNLTALPLSSDRKRDSSNTDTNVTKKPKV